MERDRRGEEETERSRGKKQREILQGGQRAVPLEARAEDLYS
jgi:hypothetical protein